MVKPRYIKKVLEEFKITDYLKSKGISPTSSRNSDRTQYRCPSPNHDDSTPSFYVFHDREYEAFKCFGCLINGDIINLYCILEKVSLRAAISHFAKGIDVDENDMLSSLLEDISEQNTAYGENLLQTALQISLVSRHCLEQVNYSPDIISKMDKALEKVDVVIRSMDIELLKRLYDVLTMEVFPKVLDDYQKERENELLQRNS